MGCSIVYGNGKKKGGVVTAKCPNLLTWKERKGRGVPHCRDQFSIWGKKRGKKGIMFQRIGSAVWKKEKGRSG